jgi:hypothetical protein
MQQQRLFYRSKSLPYLDASEIELSPAEIARKIHDDGSDN